MKLSCRNLAFTGVGAPLETSSHGATSINFSIYVRRVIVSLLANNLHICEWRAVGKHFPMPAKHTSCLLSSQTTIPQTNTQPRVEQTDTKEKERLSHMSARQTLHEMLSRSVKHTHAK